jgi:hypothetical protein
LAIVIAVVIVIALVFVLPALVLPAIIAVMVFVPFVVVLDVAVFSFPIAVEEHAAFIAWAYPPGSHIRSGCPVTLVPLVMVTDGVPVALDPHIFRAWTDWNHNHSPRRRRRPDSDSDRDLSAKHRHASKESYR